MLLPWPNRCGIILLVETRCARQRPVVRKPGRQGQTRMKDVSPNQVLTLSLSAHSRLSKEHLVPQYDLEALWEEHCRYEFETRDVDATMATMIDAPYVNHIPTMTGGVLGIAPSPMSMANVS